MIRQTKELVLEPQAPSEAGATIGLGVTAALNTTIAGLGTTTAFVGYLKGIITGITTDADGGDSSVDVKIVSRVETVGSGATETRVDYAESNRGKAFAVSDNLFFVNSSGVNSDWSWILFSISKQC